jgi:hypothetical protein
VREKNQENCFTLIVEKMIENREEQDDCRQAYDSEFQEMLELSQTLLQADFSQESLIRDELRLRLLEKFRKSNPVQLDDLGLDELDENELSAVAGGLTGGTEKIGCSLCACTRLAETIENEICPVCGHTRVMHSG